MRLAGSYLIRDIFFQPLRKMFHNVKRNMDEQLLYGIDEEIIGNLITESEELVGIIMDELRRIE